MKRVLSTVLSFICIAIWLKSIWYTDSRLSVYVYIAIISAIAAIELAIKPAENNKRDKICSAVYAGLIALAVALANYPLYIATSTTYTEFYLKGILVFATGFVHLYLLSRFAIDRLKNLIWKKHEYKLNPLFIFAISTIVFCAIYLIIFFGKFYPGVLTVDSINQIEQGMTGNYSNHHPVYHTLLIKALVVLGANIGMNANQAVAMFTITQIVIMSVTYGYVQMTLSEIKTPIWVLILVGLSYGLLPIHIGYASTMWKDVTFGIAVVAFIVSLYRTICNVGKIKWANYVILVLSGLGFCLFRSNGLFAYVITLIVFIILYKRDQLKNILVLLGVLIVAIILKYPVLSSLNIPQHDTIEALSIPVQQIARVVAEGNEINEDEYALINHVAEVSRIPNEYDPYLADPMKNLVRASGNQDDIKKYSKDYVSLYISLGIKYPLSYLNGWVDQTKGYWNGGYHHLPCSEGVVDNGLNLWNDSKSGTITEFWNNYLITFHYSSVLQLFSSIGLAVWIALGLLILCIDRKSKEVVLIVPVLAVVLSVLISTPLYCEYRYVYAVFTSLPFLMAAVLV